MPIRPVAATALFVATVFVASPACAADEPSASITPTDPTAASAAPSYRIFNSWFGGHVAPTAEPATNASFGTTAAAHASDLVFNALGLLGIHYRLGGNTPASGFDCSGMVRYVFQNAMGLELPRRAEEISRVGAKVGRGELKPGDLVFYKTLRRAISHVGIYLGDNRFIHAPSAGGRVRVDDMGESYWATRFVGARRLD